jgi:LysM repeat protein
MKDDPDLQMDDAWSEGRAYSPKRRGGGSASSGYLLVLVIVILVLIFAGGILYFLGRPPTKSGVEPLQSKVVALEERIAGLEKGIAELQGKITTPAPDLALLQRADALSQKVEALEKQKPPAQKVEALEKQKPSSAEPKAKPLTSTKPAASAEKKYHLVLKGETLYGISKKYGISVEELRKLNDLSKESSLRTGQKLLVR